MKRQGFLRFPVAFATGLFAAVFLLGCDDLFRPPLVQDTGFQPGDYQAVTETGQMYQRLIDLKINHMERILETVFEFDPELLDSRSTRYVGASKVFNMPELFNAIDFGKTRGGLARSAGLQNEPTLSEELKRLDNFQAQLMEEFAVTDLSFLDGYLEYTMVDGVIYYGNCNAIDPRSITGILQLHLIKSELAGDNFTAILDDLTMVASNYTGGTDRARGAFEGVMMSYSFWPDKKVYFRWQAGMDMVSRYRYEIALNSWETVAGYIQFVDLTDDPAQFDWYVTSGWPVAQLNAANFDKNGGFVGFLGAAYYNLNNCYISTYYDPQYGFYVPRHELGHLLGLRHEQERWDRDEHILWQSADNHFFGPTFPKATLASQGFYISFITIQVGLGNYMYIPMVLYSYGANSNLTGNGTPYYDYLSVMHYPTESIKTMRTKKAMQGLPPDGVIPINPISEGDIATVEMIYRSY